MALQALGGDGSSAGSLNLSGMPGFLSAIQGMSTNGNFGIPSGGLAALHAASAPAPAGPSLSSIMQQIVSALAGAAPTAVTAQTSGPAPTLANYWDASPYTAALNSLSAGNKTAQTSTDQAYQQALAALSAQNKTADTTAQTNIGNATTDANNATSQENAQLGAAPGGIGAGTSTGAAIGGEKAVLTANNARGVQQAQNLKGLMDANQSGQMAATTADQKNALAYLASQVSGEGDKINLAEAQGKSAAQQAFAQAMNAYETNQQNNVNSAATTNSKNQATYASSLQNAMKQALAVEQSLATSGSQSVEDQLNNGQIQGPMANAVNFVLKGAAGVNGQQGTPAAKDLPDALSRLQDPGFQSQLKQQGVDINQLTGLVKQYYSTTKQQPTPSALEAWLQSAGL